MMETIWDEKIDPEHPSGLCALCDNAMEEFEPTCFIIAHGVKYGAHQYCMADEIDASPQEPSDERPPA